MTETAFTAPPLLAVPNVSEGRDHDTIAAIAHAAEPAARLLDVQSDPDHHRTVLTLAGSPGRLYQAVLAVAREALQRIDLTRHHGIHPRVGAIDVAPIVHLDEARRGPAAAEALVLADALGELGLPVYLYGSLSQRGHTRAQLRRPGALAELAPDFGPRHGHPTGGAVLVAARPPLVAFNINLTADAAPEQARTIAARIREGGDDGFPGVRAIGLWLPTIARAQVSLNVEDHTAVPLYRIVERVRAYAAIEACELIGLAPRAAFDGFPDDLPVHNRRTVEDALG